MWLESSIDCYILGFLLNLMKLFDFVIFMSCWKYSTNSWSYFGHNCDSSEFNEINRLNLIEDAKRILFLWQQLLDFSAEMF